MAERIDSIMATLINEARQAAESEDYETVEACLDAIEERAQTWADAVGNLRVLR